MFLKDPSDGVKWEGSTESLEDMGRWIRGYDNNLGRRRGYLWT